MGFRAVKRIDGSPYNGEHNPYTIAADATVIYKDAPVTWHTDGTIKAAAAGDLHVGTLLGVEYLHPTLGQQYSTYWPGATTGATNIVAHVCDDPDIIYEAPMRDSYGAVVDITVRGLAADLYVPSPAGNTATGSSNVQVGTPKTSTNEGVYHIYRKSPTVDNTGTTSVLVWVTVVKHAARAIVSRATA